MEAACQSFPLTWVIRTTGAMALPAGPSDGAEPYVAQRTSIVFMRRPDVRDHLSALDRPPGGADAGPTAHPVASTTSFRARSLGRQARVAVPDLVERRGGEGRRGAWT